MAGVVENVLRLVGDTPLVRLNRLPSPGSATVLVKLEARNPGGSVKDRIALAMIEEAEAQGKLKPGDTIVEPTSGNTGVGLAMVAAVKGYRLILTMPEDMSAERRTLLSLYGAELVLTPAIEGMSGAIFAADELVREHGYFMPQQFLHYVNGEEVRSLEGLRTQLKDGDEVAIIPAVAGGR
ncbi:MAG: pyridoxal-phosphate dependent enzyme [Longimicrobiales bacterium]|nr:pyridoxal-phosphate dependent enzyme [Longimicrobiales bacterium]